MKVLFKTHKSNNMQIYKNIDNLLRKILLIILIFLAFKSYSQDDLSKIIDTEEEIITIIETILTVDNDSIKIEYNNTLNEKFEAILHSELSFNYTFDSLSKQISIIKSSDNLVKIYTWGIVLSDGTYKYSGFIQQKTKKKSEIELVKLYDNSLKIQNPEKEILNSENWFGCIYYDIILYKYKKNKYYTLLGWDGNDDFSTKKIIEVANFTSSGKVKFSADFKIENQNQKRIIFEYSSQAQMLLQYNEDLKMIVFDHLSPSSPKFEGNYHYYGPDFSYDAIYFDSNKWIYLSDIDFKEIE